MGCLIMRVTDLLGRRGFLETAVVATLGVGAIAEAQGPATTPGGRPLSPRDGPVGRRHIRSVLAGKPHFQNAAGSQYRVDADDFPILEAMSIRRLALAPRGVREPHWTTNAVQLSYCLRGDHLVTIADNHDRRSSFTIGAGEMYLVPSGAIHHAENIGDADGEIIEAFSHRKPEEFALSGTLGCFTDAVLGNTFGLPASALAALPRSRTDTVIGRRAAVAAVAVDERERHPFKYHLATVPPQITSAAGSVRTAQKAFWPALDTLAMFSVMLTDQGMRELHWHPETSEMGYITGGRGRMTIVSPGNIVDTFEMLPGDVYYIPKSYPHHFENIGGDAFTLIVFFDKDTPGDIGMATVVGDFSRDVLAASLGTSTAQLPDFPFLADDRLIVRRINPLDRTA